MGNLHRLGLSKRIAASVVGFAVLMPMLTWARVTVETKPTNPSIWDVVTLEYGCLGDGTRLSTTEQGFDFLISGSQFGPPAILCNYSSQILGLLDAGPVTMRLLEGSRRDYNGEVEYIEQVGEFLFDVSPAPVGISGDWIGESGETLSVVNGADGLVVSYFGQSPDGAKEVWHGTGARMTARRHLTASLVGADESGGNLSMMFGPACRSADVRIVTSSGVRQFRANARRDTRRACELMDIHSLKPICYRGTFGAYGGLDSSYSFIPYGPQIEHVEVIDNGRATTVLGDMIGFRIEDLDGNTIAHEDRLRLRYCVSELGHDGELVYMSYVFPESAGSSLRFGAPDGPVIAVGPSAAEPRKTLAGLEEGAYYLVEENSARSGDVRAVIRLSPHLEVLQRITYRIEPEQPTTDDEILVIGRVHPCYVDNWWVLVEQQWDGTRLQLGYEQRPKDAFDCELEPISIGPLPPGVFSVTAGENDAIDRDDILRHQEFTVVQAAPDIGAGLWSGGASTSGAFVNRVAEGYIFTVFGSNANGPFWVQSEPTTEMSADNVLQVDVRGPESDETSMLRVTLDDCNSGQFVLSSHQWEAALELTVRPAHTAECSF